MTLCLYECVNKMNGEDTECEFHCIRVYVCVCVCMNSHLGNKWGEIFKFDVHANRIHIQNGIAFSKTKQYWRRVKISSSMHYEIFTINAIEIFGWIVFIFDLFIFSYDLLCLLLIHIWFVYQNLPSITASFHNFEWRKIYNDYIGWVWNFSMCKIK